MATNPPKDGSRIGAIRERSQIQNPKTGLWIKRDANTGKFMDVKTSGGKFKGVRKEQEKHNWLMCSAKPSGREVEGVFNFN